MESNEEVIIGNKIILTVVTMCWGRMGREAWRMNDRKLYGLSQMTERSFVAHLHKKQLQDMVLGISIITKIKWSKDKNVFLAEHYRKYDYNKTSSSKKKYSSSIP